MRCGYQTMLAHLSNRFAATIEAISMGDEMAAVTHSLDGYLLSTDACAQTDAERNAKKWGTAMLAEREKIRATAGSSTQSVHYRLAKRAQTENSFFRNDGQQAGPQPPSSSSSASPPTSTTSTTTSTTTPTTQPALPTTLPPTPPGQGEYQLSYNAATNTVVWVPIPAADRGVSFRTRNKSRNWRGSGGGGGWGGAGRGENSGNFRSRGKRGKGGGFGGGSGAGRGEPGTKSLPLPNPNSQ